MSSDVLKHICPVCGFLLDYPAKDFNICPSCGVEFDADTVEYTIQELRQSWFDRGLEWTSPVIPKPEHFNPMRAEKQSLSIELLLHDRANIR